MKKTIVPLLATLFISIPATAQWTEYFQPSWVETHNFGVFIRTSLTGLQATDCDPAHNYAFASFLNDDLTLADRALSTAYFAIASKKNLRVSVIRCQGDWAIANAIWVE